MADKKEKEKKAIVEAILKQKGKSYDEWLNEKHLEFITENAGTLLSALNSKEGK